MKYSHRVHQAAVLSGQHTLAALSCSTDPVSGARNSWKPKF